MCRFPTNDVTFLEAINLNIDVIGVVALQVEEVLSIHLLNGFSVGITKTEAPLCTVRLSNV